jgi:hypothetical protein
VVSHESGHQSIEAQGLWLHRSGRRSQSSKSIGLAPGHKGPLTTLLIHTMFCFIITLQTPTPYTPQPHATASATALLSFSSYQRQSAPLSAHIACTQWVPYTESGGHRVRSLAHLLLLALPPMCLPQVYTNLFTPGKSGWLKTCAPP